MDSSNFSTPFHAGEIEAQSLAGAGDVAQWARGFIRAHLPEQHRDFHSQLPFLIASGADNKGNTWVTLIEGPEGFIRSPDPRSIDLKTSIDSYDPLAESFQSGASIGVLGIELATRRRNRFSGHISNTAKGMSITINQTFGNCPQYIHPRNWHRVDQTVDKQSETTESLNGHQIAQVAAADTLFIGSGQQQTANDPSSGFDASHRGGAPGFVRVVSPTQLQIPDYAGNNFFNTIGNLITDSRVGLLFVDFETGGLLHISGRAEVDWTPKHTHDSDAKRMINVDIEQVIERPSAISLRWTKPKQPAYELELVARKAESDAITSFYFVPTNQPIKPFKAGQHLPIEVTLKDQQKPLERSYSLSSSHYDLSHYRISVKREDNGTVSRFLHDQLAVGDRIEAHQPSGDFTPPCTDCPMVLVSAGVGLTPVLSMLHSLVWHKNRVWFVHGTRDGASHALGHEVDKLVQDNPFIETQVYFSRPRDVDIKGTDFDMTGRISAEHLIKLNAGKKAHYMLCGPSAFIADLSSGLEQAGVASEQIHFESFGA